MLQYGKVREPIKKRNCAYLISCRITALHRLSLTKTRTQFL